MIFLFHILHNGALSCPQSGRLQGTGSISPRWGKVSDLVTGVFLQADNPNHSALLADLIIVCYKLQGWGKQSLHLNISQMNNQINSLGAPHHKIEIL